MSANEDGEDFIAMIMQGKNGGCSRALGDVAAGQPPPMLIGLMIICRCLPNSLAQNFPRG